MTTRANKGGGGLRFPPIIFPCFFFSTLHQDYRVENELVWAFFNLTPLLAAAVPAPPTLQLHTSTMDTDGSTPGSAPKVPRAKACYRWVALPCRCASTKVGRRQGAWRRGGCAPRCLSRRCPGQKITWARELWGVGKHLVRTRSSFRTRGRSHLFVRNATLARANASRS